MSKAESVGNHPENELIPCDVCDEKFDTVTKAISHKFRKHPDTQNNNFCPWCGKQFPIKVCSFLTSLEISSWGSSWQGYINGNYIALNMPIITIDHDLGSFI